MHVAMVNTRQAMQAKGETVDNAALQKEFTYVSKADTVAKLKKSVEDVKVVVDAPDCLRLIGALEMLANKRDRNPPKKHGSIPL